MFAIAKKGKQQQKIRQLQCQKQRLDHIPYHISGLSYAHFFLQTFSRSFNQGCIMQSDQHLFSPKDINA